jgi:outer membrane receptor for ferrienterochelin and colicins
MTHNRPLRRLTAIAAAAVAVPASAQDTTQARARPDSLATLSVDVRQDTLPVEAATVRSGRMRTNTDARGRGVLRLAGGEHRLIAVKLGFKPETLVVSVRAGVDMSVIMQLVEQPAELSGVVVSATRSERRIEDEPLRVEVLTQEEVEEKLRMTPGDITMMLNESSGLRVQTTSPSLGGANVRVQGLRGRYTQILVDGLPLHGGQTGGLGLLQIPPMDLAGVEVIKGVASALYGGSALGGVINLVSRRPGEEPVRDLLFNQTTLGGTDGVGFASGLVSDHWGYTLLAGAHRQTRVDRDHDRWTDLAGYERGLIRPRAFWSHPRGHSLMVTAGATLETRDGGTVGGAAAPDGAPYPEALRTRRYDAGGVGRLLVGRSAVLSARGSATVQQHRHTFGEVRERDEHLTWFGETALSVTRGISLWVLGAALQQERYQAKDVAAFNYAFAIPGLFAQHTVDFGKRIALTASARVDQHSAYGTQWAPRVSALIRLAARWSVRASAGGGYFAPTPFNEETEVIGLTPLEPLRNLRPERARSGSLDVGGGLGPVELNATLFGSAIDRPVGLRPVASNSGRVELANVDGPTRTKGAEMLLRWKPEPFQLTATYTFVRSAEEDSETGVRRDVPLTPRHQAGVVGMWEDEQRARIGVEVYYTGRQSLEDNPYRSRSVPYVHVGALAERRFGRARAFVNAENLLNNRQTRYDPLVLPARGLGGRWTTDVWGPLEGRVANVGVRLDVR